MEILRNYNSETKSGHIFPVLVESWSWSSSTLFVDSGVDFCSDDALLSTGREYGDLGQGL